MARDGLRDSQLIIHDRARYQRYMAAFRQCDNGVTRTDLDRPFCRWMRAMTAIACDDILVYACLHK